MTFLEGDLAEIPVAAVLIEALNERVAGVLRVDHGQGVSRLFLRAGIPVAAQSFTAFRPLGAALASAGVITMDALEQSLAEMARTGRRQGDVLVALGAATREQVDAALAAQQSAYLSEIAGLSRGRFSFDAAAEVPPWVDGVRISPLQAIVGALETAQAQHLVASALRMATRGPIRLAHGYGRLASEFGWSAAEAALVDRLAATTALDDFFVATPVAPERARAILAALLLLGLAAAQEAPVGDPEPDDVIDLADLAATPIAPSDPPLADPATTRERAAAPPAPGGAESAAAPRRRSDPEEARRRRQRLLRRAMQNMGVGPFAAHAPPSAPQAGASAGAALDAVEAAEYAELRRAFAAAAPRARSADLFERLGVPADATAEQVKLAYFQLARQLHPDRFQVAALADVAGQVPDFFAAINEAYDVLSDRHKRAAYVAARRESGAPHDPAAAAQAFQRAEACVKTHDVERARGFFEAAVRADPRPEYLAAYAALLYGTRSPADRARAKELADAALRDPGSDRAALVRGLIACDEGDLEGAERLLRRAVAANPRNADAARELRLLEARRGGAAPSDRDPRGRRR